MRCDTCNSVFDLRMSNDDSDEQEAASNQTMVCMNDDNNDTELKQMVAHQLNTRRLNAMRRELSIAYRCANIVFGGGDSI